MDNILYLPSYGSDLSLTLPSTGAGTLKYQHPVNGRNIRKDIANSTPGTQILDTVLLRTEKTGGVVYNVYVVTFAHDVTNSDGTLKVTLSSTCTFRIPTQVVSNLDLTNFATEIWTRFAANGTPGTVGLAATPSQLAELFMGDL